MAELGMDGAKGAAKGTVSKTVDVFVDYIVPIGIGFGGFAAGTRLLGGQTIAGLLAATPQTGINSAQSYMILGLVLAAVAGVIGIAFWRLGKRDGWVMHLVGKGIGALFIGTAFSYLVFNVLAQQNPPYGLLDYINEGIQGLAKGA